MQLSKAYNPHEHEQKIYELWEKSGAFKPAGKGQPFSLVIPPPNANGDLHIGHALTFGLEDIAARFHRLKGDNTLVLPGTDHAGFETWVVYEKQLAKAGKSRFDYSREELYQQVWDFVAKYRNHAISQLRKLGLSADWDYFTFTLDEKIVARAFKSFQKMWIEDLIYRGKRLVNFCTFHETAFADIEVIYKQEKGKLWYIRYPLSDKSGHIVVATTRPETMLGDTAVAVNPNDKRYKAMIGKTVVVPIAEREVPIIADDFVDAGFGTGVVKITPAHDPNDFDVGQRHNLPQITVITEKGTVADDTPAPYRKLAVTIARNKIVQDLDTLGYLEKTEEIRHSVGHCYKCNTVIEPLLREQWFVDMQPLAKQAIDHLAKGEITFYPDVKKDQLVEYLKSLKDWNISRQIPWGIPIPAFQNVDEPDDWVYDERVNEEIITIGDKTYHRDPDVFDTWFSSSSWPYATLGYPDTYEYKTFYPLSVMETGGEILYPWVSRMIMLGLYVTGKVPFKSVYVHGYVLAEDGAKMSKSIGNVVDPIQIIDKYGSDALRMGILASRAPAINRGYDHRKVEDARNFSNKLWNIARFTNESVGDRKSLPKLEPQSSADYWILSKLASLSSDISDDLMHYRFAESYDKIYHFVWDNYADWYIEASKVIPNASVLLHCLAAILKVTHPFAPFLTEAIWQASEWKDSPLLITSSWPKISSANPKLGHPFEEVKDIVSEIRYYAYILKVSKPAILVGPDDFITEYTDLIQKMARVNSVKGQKSASPSGLRLNNTKHPIWLVVEENALNKYRSELAEKISTESSRVKQLEERLANKNYIKNAPTEVVDQSKTLLNEASAKITSYKSEISRLQHID